jgi:hypothetical protein
MMSFPHSKRLDHLKYFDAHLSHTTHTPAPKQTSGISWYIKDKADATNRNQVILLRQLRNFIFVP